MPRKVLILGATSAIAQETAKRLAADGDRLFLVGRDAGRLDVVASDLTVRGAQHVATLAADLSDLERHAEIVESATTALDGLDTVLVAHGLLGDPESCHADFSAAREVLDTNFTSVVSILTPIVHRFEEQGAGTIVGISSVAGDRGRQSNYHYGAAKGALSLYLQGLRNRLYTAGVHVVTVKPGFVDTPMTAHIKKGLLFAGPATIARGIHQAIRRRRDVVYLPWFWRPIMLVVRTIPERLFKRLKL